MLDLPSGVVTFLFTDIEGSTRLWETEATRMADALARHDELCRATVETHGGRLIKMIGDGLHAVFRDPAAAIRTVLDLQRGMATIGSDCGIAFKMRCGLHTGEAQERDGDYFGSAVNRAARIMSAAHGGQVLLSQRVVDLVNARDEGVEFTHLGRVRLRDLAGAEDVWQLSHGDLPRMFPALRSLDSTPNNLPLQLTSFIGREREIAAIRAHLDKTRLLTLTGSGGCGKTRLALHMAAEVLDTYPDGVWLVELAALADQELLPQTVAVVLGLREEPGRPFTQTLTDFLKSRRLLLVLDNAEHLLAACAKLAGAVLSQCPQVVLLVSSREGLGIAGEVTFRVPSLSLPDPARDISPESLLPFESVRLFIERAQSHSPQFAISLRNAPALASVCCRLDGIPLALELAAARIRSMSLEEINKRLDQRFRLLTGGSRTALPRQQTLRWLIDWSYDLLQPAEQALLCRLAIFAGGWTLEAAEQVCMGDGVDSVDMLDLHASLADKSLVMAEERGGTMRYRLLETVRQYARDRLFESGQGESWRDRHLNHFLSLAEEAEPKLTGADQQAWLDRLDVEHDNLRAAMTWSSSSDDSVDRQLRLAGAFWRFWSVRGYMVEGRARLAELMASSSSDRAAHAKALNGAGVLAWQQGDYPAAKAHYEECLALRRVLGDRRGVSASLNNLGAVAQSRGESLAAKSLYEESLVLKRELGDRRGIASSLSNLASVTFDLGDYATGRTLSEESLEIFRALGDRQSISASLTNMGLMATHLRDFSSAKALFEESFAIRRELGDQWGIAASLNDLGHVACEQGDLAGACDLHERSMTMYRELGDPRGIVESLEAFAYVALARSGWRRAVRIASYAEGLRKEIGCPQPPRGRPDYNAKFAVAREAMGGDMFDRAWREGQGMSLEQTIELALAKADD